jgi:hypothetical protein
MKTRRSSKSRSKSGSQPRSRNRTFRSSHPTSMGAPPGVLVDAGGLPFGWPRKTPVDAAEQRWLNEACTLAAASSREIHGPDAIGSLLLDVSIVGRAAEQLWSAMPGAPSWVLLDVDALVARFERELRGLRDTAVVTVVAFVHWLRSHGHVSEADALVLIGRLQPHLPEVFFEMGYPRGPLPPSLRPS